MNEGSIKKREDWVKTNRINGLTDQRKRDKKSSFHVGGYEVMELSFRENPSCSGVDSGYSARGKPFWGVPSPKGRFGHVGEVDLTRVETGAMLEADLGKMWTTAVQGGPTTAGPPGNSHLDEIAKDIKGVGRCLILGVTGGIATGKSTVVKMLRELGAATIDLDLIAREVVEPGKPAWNEIVAYFGRQILQEDGNLDRKKLSKVVFRDKEKRRKLEKFTHPYIFEAFCEQTKKMGEEDPESIIQVDVPLLIELKLQFMFHKILVVYVPRELQIKRLARRDGISEGEAADMVKAQLPIDEKVKYADFLIHNDKSLDEVRREAEAVWMRLKKMQREGSM